MSRFAQAPVIKVLVGEDAKPFYVHEQILYDNSPYFKACFTGTTDQSMGVIDPWDLRHVNVLGFAFLVEYMYSGKLPQGILTQYDDDDINNQDDDEDNGEALEATLAYKAADQLLMHQFQNELINFEIEDCRTRKVCFGISAVKKAHELELTRTPWYRMVLRSCIPWFMKKKSKAPESFHTKLQALKVYPDAMADLMELMVQRHNKIDWKPMLEYERCSYHIHPEASMNECQHEDTMDD